MRKMTWVRFGSLIVKTIAAMILRDQLREMERQIRVLRRVA